MTQRPTANRLTREQLVQLINAMPDGDKKIRAVELAVQKYSSTATASQRAKFEPYRYRPDAYLTKFLKWSPWRGMDAEHTGQREILDACALVMRQQEEKDRYEKGEVTRKELEYWKPGQTIKNWIRVESGNGVGKCLAYDEPMLLADGRVVPVQDLIGTDFDVATLAETGEIIRTPAIAFDNGDKPVYELITETGRRIRRTDNHPLWSTRPEFRPSRQPLIAQGEWTRIDEINVGDVVAVVEDLDVFGDSPLPDDEIKLLAYLIGDGGLSNRSVRFSKGEGPQLTEYIECAERAGCRVEYVGQYDYIAYGTGERINGRQINPLIDMTRRHGLFGKKSRGKFVPSAIFGMPRAKIALFLSRLFSTDGWACLTNNSARAIGGREIGYASTSRQLIHDVQRLLQRFGVHGRITYKPKTTSWSLTINHADDQMRFIEEIGIFGKEEQLEAIAALAGPHRDRRRVEHARRPDRPRWVHKNSHANTRWERVVSVEFVGVEKTVGVEVPVYNTYVTEFYEHNTKSASGMLNWFLDCFVPSAIFTFAPGGDQARFALWAEIRKDRENKGLPGRVLETEIKVSGYHFAAHRTVSDGLGKGEERIKGKHEAFQLFILDEADGIPDFVFDSITSMTSGGNSLVVMFANPKSRASMFHRCRTRSYVQSFRVSTLYHPNVVAGHEVVPGAVKRDFVERKIENDCVIIHEHVCKRAHKHTKACYVCDIDHAAIHNPDDFTFELPYPVTVNETEYGRGTIFRPNPRFMTDILGITPPNSADNTVIPVGRYEGAKQRIPQGGDPTVARIGLDAARFGSDMGKMYVRWQDAVWLAHEFFKQKTEGYVDAIRQECLALAAKGVTNLHLRVDAGYGGGIIDSLAIDDELIRAFKEFEVFEVHFGSSKTYNKEYFDIATEMYFEAAESLKGLAVVKPPDALEIDLCEREYNYRNVSGVTKKKLEEKPEFKKRKKHSPDDGDGFVLAVAPDYCFKKVTISMIGGSMPVPLSSAASDLDDILGL